jgi:hypothetical protein
LSTLSRRTVLNLAVTATGAATIGWAAVSTGTARAGEATTSEVYQGRRIEIRGDPTHPVVLIDGRALHVMVMPDGQYASEMNHFVYMDSPLAAARSAVDALAGRRLRPTHHR